MSRKDYTAIAQAIMGERADVIATVATGGLTTADSDVALNTLDNVARSLADVLAADNPGFDRSRFLQACGVTA